MKKLTFTTRDEYTSWRSDWRSEYAEISAAIRQFRKDLKEAQRKGYVGDVCVCNSHIHTLRQSANAMLAQRVESKLRSQEQFLKAKSLQPA